MLRLIKHELQLGSWYGRFIFIKSIILKNINLKRYYLYTKTVFQGEYLNVFVNVLYTHRKLWKFIMSKLNKHNTYLTKTYGQNNHLIFFFFLSLPRVIVELLLLLLLLFWNLYILSAYGRKRLEFFSYTFLLGMYNILWWSSE